MSESRDPGGARGAEGARLTALRALRILDTPREERFDRVTRVAAELFDAPIALMSFVDADRLWAKSGFGVDTFEIPRQTAFCAHDLDRAEMLVVADASRDPRFAANPLVAGPRGIRFYAGAIVRSADGFALGRLCVLDTTARDPDEQPLQALADLAAWAERELQAGAGAPGADADPAVRDRFMAVAAHELRTPLTLIRGYSEELLDPHGGELTPQQRTATAAIVRGAHRLQQLVDDMLLMLELDNGLVRLKPRQFAPAQLVARVCDRLAADADRAGVRLEVEIATASAGIGDPARLSAALSALLRNAIAWSPREHAVRIAATERAGELRLTVSDDGPGAENGAATLAGRRFRRARSVDPREGAGVGLAIARAIAELHGGRLEAGEPDVGASLSLVLPAADQPRGGGR